MGELKTAQAIDVDGNVIYEVVYSEIQQKLKNNGKSVSLEVPRTIFFEDYVPESVIDASKTASSTTVTADQTDVTADTGIEGGHNQTGDSD